MYLFHPCSSRLVASFASYLDKKGFVGRVNLVKSINTTKYQAIRDEICVSKPGEECDAIEVTLEGKVYTSIITPADLQADEDGEYCEAYLKTVLEHTLLAAS